MIYKLALAPLLLLLCCPSLASAGLVLGYDVKEGSSLTDMFTEDASITGLALTRGNLTDAGGGTAFNSSGWSTASFLEFGFTSTKRWDLTTVRFAVGLGGSPSPERFRLRASIDGGQFAEVTPVLEFNAPSQGFSADFTNVSSLTGVDDVRFQLFATDAPATAQAASQVALEDLADGTLGFTEPSIDFAIEGNLSAVPEPSVGLLLAGAAVAATLRRRRG